MARAPKARGRRFTGARRSSPRTTRRKSHPTPASLPGRPPPAGPATAAPNALRSPSWLPRP
eukprot:1493019-Lingulodinium_polyedra.AAC.1